MSTKFPSKRKKNKPYVELDNCQEIRVLDDIPFYTGKPPKVIIPVPEDEPFHFYVKRWKIDIKSIGNTDPFVRKNLELDNSFNFLCVNKNTISIDLEDELLLGRNPFGQYRVRIIGPLGRSQEFNFKIVPELFVSGNDISYIPAIAQDENILVEMHTQLLSNLTSERNEVEVYYLSPGHYQFAVKPNQPFIDITLKKDKSLDSSPNLQFRIPVKSLRWKLIEESEIPAEWEYIPIRHSITHFDQLSDPMLSVFYSNIDRDGVLSLSLYDSKKNLLHTSKENYLLTPGLEKNFGFRLSQFKSTILGSNSPSLHFVCEYREFENHNLSLWDQPLLILRKDLNIEQFQARIIEYQGDRQIISSTWLEHEIIESRVFAIWPFWRPWEDPKLIPIADEKQNSVEIFLPELLPPGEYVIQMIVFDDWYDDVEALERPAADLSGNYCHAAVSKPTARIQQINDLEGALESFESHFELMIIYQQMQSADNYIEHRDWCLNNLTSCSVSTLLSFRSCLPRFEDDSLKAYFDQQLCTPDLIGYLSTSISNKKQKERVFQTILPTSLLEKTFNEELCMALLSTEIFGYQIFALKKLVFLAPNEAIDWIVKLVESGTLKFINGFEILNLNHAQASELLKLKKIENKTAEAFFQDLLTDDSVYSVGDWVMCGENQGYMIEEIHDLSTGEYRQKFIASDKKITLLLTNLLNFYYKEQYRLTLETNELVSTTKKKPNFFFCEDCGFFTNQSIASKEHFMRTHHNIHSVKEAIVNKLEIQKKADTTNDNETN